MVWLYFIKHPWFGKHGVKCSRFKVYSVKGLWFRLLGVRGSDTNKDKAQGYRVWGLSLSQPECLVGTLGTARSTGRDLCHVLRVSETEKDNSDQILLAYIQL